MLKDWISIADVDKGTTKVERSHQFVKYLNFGGERGMKTNNPADQEKAIIYNELVANAVALQAVADQTQVLHALRRRGIESPAEDLAHLSQNWPPNLPDALTPMGGRRTRVACMQLNPV